MDYDPTTTSGTSTTTVRLSAEAGPSGPSAGYSTSWSYSISDVVVKDRSDFAENRAYWIHDLEKNTYVAKNTYLSKPGFVVEAEEYYSSLVDAWYDVQFRKPRWWWYDLTKKFESDTLFLDYYEGGGGGGCPYLSVYNGEEYVNEGLLDIHPDTQQRQDEDVTEMHQLITSPEAVKGKYLVRLTEHPKTHSFIDQVQLMATLENGKNITLPLASAVHSTDGKIMRALLLSDDVRTDTMGGRFNDGDSEYIDLSFTAPQGLAIRDLYFRIQGHNYEIK
ncbi:MAG: hypothetical protein GWO20_19715 [Candidatus Korarchaeota archaeon]|nr:hypothetical protein [Candidatus Korarchaeota archaeon]NIU82239.1 hypothetical protein [Candidatus Thorarchaeota archaeon]NIW15580.1 hypothetical protein [Candidatus Thorarchaeota archaeon]